MLGCVGGGVECGSDFWENGGEGGYALNKSSVLTAWWEFWLIFLIFPYIFSILTWNVKKLDSYNFLISTSIILIVLFWFILQLTTMLILVIILFMVCWSPYFMILVLISFNALENSLLVEKVFNIFNLIAIMNSAMNPLIYAFFSPTFRASTVWAITSLFRWGHSRHTSKLNYGHASWVRHPKMVATLRFYQVCFVQCTISQENKVLTWLWSH